MAYPKVPDFKALAEQLELYSQLKHEQGARGIARVLEGAERDVRKAVVALTRLRVDPALAGKEPDDLAGIRELRPRGPRKTLRSLDEGAYRERLEGALLGRMAGCTLGAPVEGWSVQAMEEQAQASGEPFPPRDYWRTVPFPLRKRYEVSRCVEYTRGGMDGVPVDDDIAYTLLGLLVLEDYGPGFTIEENSKAWLRYLPMACTAEHVALENLKAGVAARRAAEKGNPYCEWIGADIRSDPWGYVAPGLPERAADMAYRDAYLSHRRNGIYGEMYFSAAIAAAFSVDDPMEALAIGLTEIPRECAMAKAVRWALRAAPQVRDYRQARAAVDRKFAGMHVVHTINNACLTIFGVAIGGRDLTRVIGETVAMGLDNDCTAATAGSIAGAVVGRKGVAPHWHSRFNDRVCSYLRGHPTFAITDLVDRFSGQARKVWKAADAEGRETPRRSSRS